MRKINIMEGDRLWKLLVIALCICANGGHCRLSGARRADFEADRQRRPSQIEASSSCVPVDKQQENIVCVCNKDHCDSFQYDFPKQSGSVQLIRSTKSGQRFEVTNLKSDSSSSVALPDDSIQVDLGKRHQSILGWGGAFTDATGVNVRSLSGRLQNLLLASYFDRDGLRYNIGRVPIGGSDFSPRNYTYDDLEPGQVDLSLSKWALAREDHEYKLPLIKRALEMRAGHSSDKLKLFGSPWSPPYWMKDNHNITRGHLIDDSVIYQAWANYQVKFYQAYQRELGLQFWGGTVQNEPVSAESPSYFFNSLQMDSAQMAKYVGQFLGPTLESNGFTKDKFKLMVGDDNIGLINGLVPPLLKDTQASKYVSGLAFHWYASGWQQPYSKLTDCLDEIKDKVEFVLMTEACAGFRKGQEPPVILGSWERGEQYAVDIFQDLLRQSAGWVDWNMALGVDGGPNWVNNTVDSPIIVNKDKDEFYKQPMYYVLGHFSRFFQPGSVRVDTRPFTGGYTDTLMTVAVHDEKLGIVALNLFNRLNVQRKLSVRIGGQYRSANANFTISNVLLEPRSINTLVLKL